MKDQSTILNLLNKFAQDHENVSWKMECVYSDGLSTTLNQIKIMAQPGNRIVGFITFKVETGLVLFCMYKDMQKTESQNIVDMLLDMMNHSKGEKV